MIDSRAIIHPSAKIADNVEIGPFSVIGANVEIGEGTVIGPHVVIQGTTIIGQNNRIFQFASIGEDPQDKKFSGEENSRLSIGDHNYIREFVTINRGTEQGGGVTKLGHHNHIMAYVHVAHDCIVGSHTVFSNNASLAGHVIVDDYVTLGGFVGVHQFCAIGAYSFCAGGSIVVKDVPPYLMVQGYPAAPYGLNIVGLKRHGFTLDMISRLKQAYRHLYREGLTVEEATQKINALSADCDVLPPFVSFVLESTRGIVR